MKRRDLTQEETTWKNNLVKIWKVKKQELNLNQEKLAELIGWSSQGSVGQYLTGRIPLNTDAKIKFAQALGVSPSEIDPNIPVNNEKTPSNAAEFLAQFGDGLKGFSREDQLKIAQKLIEFASASTD